MAIFPYQLAASGSEQDSKKFSEELEDPSDGLQTDMEGGYVVSRARHTRTPRRTWTSGFSFITTADRNELRTFWNTVKGGSDIFQWRNPADEQDYNVRFKGTLKFTYVGRLSNQRWDCQFTVEEA